MTVLSKILVCGYVPSKADENTLYELFLQFGPVDEVTLDTRSQVAVIIFKYSESVQYSIDALKYTKLYGNKMTLYPAEDVENDFRTAIDSPNSSRKRAAPYDSIEDDIESSSCSTDDRAESSISSPPPAKRTRYIYSIDQKVKLEGHFYSSNYILKGSRPNIAEQIGVSEQRIKVWFQNRRSKKKREDQAIKDMNEETRLQNIADDLNDEVDESEPGYATQLNEIQENVQDPDNDYEEGYGDLYIDENYVPDRNYSYNVYSHQDSSDEVENEDGQMASTGGMVPDAQEHRYSVPDVIYEPPIIEPLHPSQVWSTTQVPQYLTYPNQHLGNQFQMNRESQMFPEFQRNNTFYQHQLYEENESFQQRPVLDSHKFPSQGYYQPTETGFFPCYGQGHTCIQPQPQTQRQTNFTDCMQMNRFVNVPPQYNMYENQSLTNITDQNDGQVRERYGGENANTYHQAYGVLRLHRNSDQFGTSAGGQHNNM